VLMCIEAMASLSLSWHICLPCQYLDYDISVHFLDSQICCTCQSYNNTQTP
jgi:hypothetical protein